MSMYAPLVSIITPVYNGEKYLAACIESVLAQTYQNWEYTIVNNCSTDSTLVVANRYAEIDGRIHVHNYDEFVEVIPSHNRALNLISLHSKYCKVVSADDWLFPECITRLVETAETNPSVVIVGSYRLSGGKVQFKGIPDKVRFISGREVCRLSLINNMYVFGAPTNLLYRSDLIRKNKPFFPHNLPHADASACYKYLQYDDFGFVHEVLSIERIHNQQESTKLAKLSTTYVTDIQIFLEYGPIYLSEREFETKKNEILDHYYRWLGASVLKMKHKEFWKYHTSSFRSLGFPIPWRKVLRGTLDEILEEIRNPKVAYQKFIIALRERRISRN